MKRLLGGAALALLCAVACGDDDNGGKPDANGGEGGETTHGPSTQGGADDDGEGGNGARAGSVNTGGTIPQSDGGADNDGGTPPVAGGTDAGGAGGAGGADNGPVAGDIHGKLVRGLAGVPDVRVVVDGRSTYTDENGDYAFTDVPAHYDLAFVFEDDQVVNGYAGLTTRTPVTAWPSPPTGKSAQVAGKLTGSAIPLAAGQSGAVKFFAKDAAVSEALQLAEAEGTYSLGPIGWEVGDELPGTLQALTWTPGELAPTDFTGFALKPFTLQNGQEHGNVNGSVAATNLALVDPEERTVSGTFNLPLTMEPGISLMLIGGVDIPVEPAVGNFSFAIPEVDANVLVAFVAGNKADSGSSSALQHPPASGKWNVTLPKPQELTEPEDEADDVTPSTEFTWTNVADIVVYMNIQVGGWTMYWTTAESKSTLPDLSAIDFEYTPGALGSWSVSGIGPATTADEFMLLETKMYASTARFEMTAANSSSRSFKLAE